MENQPTSFQLTLPTEPKKLITNMFGCSNVQWSNLGKDII